MALKRVDEKTIKNLTGKCVDVNLGSGFIRKSRIKKVYKQRNVKGEMILVVTVLSENYERQIYENEIVKYY